MPDRADYAAGGVHTVSDADKPAPSPAPAIAPAGPLQRDTDRASRPGFRSPPNQKSKAQKGPGKKKKG